MTGWTYFLDGTKDPTQCVHQWLGDWKDPSGNIVTYGFRYEQLSCSTVALRQIFKWGPGTLPRMSRANGRRPWRSGRRTTTRSNIRRIVAGKPWDRAMDKMIIHGGVPLRGAVALSGSKNATLPILMASLLTDEPVMIRNVPHLRDVQTAMALLSGLGVRRAGSATISWFAGREPDLARGALRTGQNDARVVFRARAVAGARETRPGFDSRRMRDRRAPGQSAYHGNSRSRRAGSIAQRLCRGACRPLKGARIWLDNPTVGATENIMMAAVRARGRTAIENAAREPEVQDLAKFLLAMGAQHARRRHSRHRNRRRREASWRRTRGHSRSHRGGFADGRGGDHRRRPVDSQMRRSISSRR